MENQQAPISKDQPGLIAGMAGLAKNMFGLVVSRIELAALELSEVRTNLLKVLLVGALGFVVAWFAIAYWSMVIVVLAWPSIGWKILLLLAVLFSAAAAGLFFYVKSLLAQGKLSMPATMSELRSDRDSLL
ncbi:MAG: hypothetical protein JWQ23_3322 [Herminiimonas sp.]|nr:hypothetical protein [Herminiimonas sp.]